METAKKMTIEECRDSLLMSGTECRSKYHKRKDRCRYCGLEDGGVGMSCVLEEKATLETFLEDLGLSKDPGFDIFTITAIENWPKYVDYFGREALLEEFNHDVWYRWAMRKKKLRETIEALTTIEED